MQTRPFELGQVLGGTVSLLLANFVPFMALSAIALSPIIATTFYVYLAGSAQVREAYDLTATFMTIVLGPIATAAITYGVFENLRGKPWSVTSCLRTGLWRFFPVIAVSVMTVVAVFGPFMLVAVPAFSMVERAPLASGAALLGTFALWTLPALILATMLYVAVPSCVIERPGVLGALRRSRELTIGYRLPVMAVLFTLGSINLVLSVVIELALGGTGLVYHTVSLVWSLFLTALHATATALVYHRLRSLKETIDVDEVATVFA